MDEKIKKGLSIFVAGYLTYSVIVHPSGENPHIHAEKYNLNPSVYNNYTVVVSGTQLRAELPYFITDLGASPVNPSENLFGIILTSSLDSLKR